MKLGTLSARSRMLADDVWAEAKGNSSSLGYDVSGKLKRISTEIHDLASKLEKIENQIVGKVHDS